jgi:hypothetical protein
MKNGTLPTMMCIQCAMRAMLDGQPSPMFDETPEQHRHRVHPDLAATRVERRELERRLAEKLKEELKPA